MFIQFIINDFNKAITNGKVEHLMIWKDITKQTK